jgi:hypothetical protein
MTLYDIDKKMLSLIDEETGELLDFEAFERLQMERDQKIENMALWYKDLCAEAKAIKDEIAILTERKKAAENKAERLRKYIEFALNGNPYKSSKCAVSFRKTSSLEVVDDLKLIEWAEQSGHDDCLKYTEPEIKKKAVTDLIKSGVEVPFAQIVNGQSLVVK